MDDLVLVTAFKTVPNSIRGVRETPWLQTSPPAAFCVELGRRAVTSFYGELNSRAISSEDIHT